MKYKLFFSDIDDTLVKVAGTKLSDYTISKIKEFKKKGLKFIPCTGRALNTIPANLTSELFDNAIFINGAIIYDAINKKDIRELYLDLDIATEIVKFCKKLDVIVVFFMDGEQCADQNNASKMYSDPIFSEFIITGINIVDDLENAIKRDKLKIGKFLLYTHKKQEYTALLKEHFKDVCYSSFNDLSIEITHIDAYKGNAVKHVADMYGVDLKDCIYAGDNDNDLSALSIVGMPIVPSNGSKSSKDIAKIIADDCEHDGVIKEVEKLLLE